MDITLTVLHYVRYIKSSDAALYTYRGHTNNTTVTISNSYHEVIIEGIRILTEIQY